MIAKRASEKSHKDNNPSSDKHSPVIHRTPPSLTESPVFFPDSMKLRGMSPQAKIETLFNPVGISITIPVKY